MSTAKQVAILIGIVGDLVAIVQFLVKESEMAKKLAEYVADIQAQMAALTSKVTEQSTVVNGVKVILQGQAAQIAALKQQVQDAIDAGGDPTVLEPIVLALQAQVDAIDTNTDALGEAAVANT